MVIVIKLDMDVISGILQFLVIRMFMMSSWEQGAEGKEKKKSVRYHKDENNKWLEIVQS